MSSDLYDDALVTRGTLRDKKIVVSIKNLQEHSAVLLNVELASGSALNLFFYPHNNYKSSDVPDAKQATFTNFRGRTIAIDASFFTLPINSIVVKRSTAAGYKELCVDREFYFLANMWPKTSDEFEKKFFRNKDRCKDAMALSFQLDQIIRFYKGEPSHVIVSAVIYAYRTLELEDEDMVRRAIEYLRKSQSILPHLQRTTDVRTDKEHLRGSINVVLWHLYLYLGESGAFRKELEDGYIAYKKDSGMHHMCAFNLCRTILAYGLLLEARGEKRQAINAYKNAIAWYRYSVTSGGSVPYSVMFLELVESHMAVHIACCLVEFLKGKIGSRPKDSEIFAAISRVPKYKAQNRLMRNFFSAIREPLIASSI